MRQSTSVSLIGARTTPSKRSTFYVRYYTPFRPKNWYQNLVPETLLVCHGPYTHLDRMHSHDFYVKMCVEQTARAIFCTSWNTGWISARKLIFREKANGCAKYAHAPIRNTVTAALTRPRVSRCIAGFNQSINQSKQISIAPCVASESEARDSRD